MSRYIDAERFDIFDAVKPEQYDTESFMAGMEVVLDDIKDAPTIEPKILDDGTLVVKVEDGSKVGRVLVEWGDHFCGLYYADAEPKQGEWIYGEDEYGLDGWHCSKCRHHIKWDYSMTLEEAEKHIPNFCPNCGARMKGAK